MGMIAVIVCGTAFAGNLNEIKASAVSDDDLSSSTPDKMVTHYLQTISLLHLPCQKQRQILSLKQ